MGKKVLDIILTVLTLGITAIVRRQNKKRRHQAGGKEKKHEETPQG